VGFPASLRNFREVTEFCLLSLSNSEGEGKRGKGGGEEGRGGRGGGEGGMEDPVAVTGSKLKNRLDPLENCLGCSHIGDIYSFILWEGEGG
jgi:hypothetical protein